MQRVESEFDKLFSFADIIKLQFDSVCVCRSTSSNTGDGADKNARANKDGS